MKLHMGNIRVKNIYIGRDSMYENYAYNYF